MLVIFKHTIGPVSVTAKLKIKERAEINLLYTILGLQIVGVYVSGDDEEYEVNYKPLVGCISVPRVLRFVNMLSKFGWSVDKQNFINYHYGYKKPYTPDSEKPKETLTNIVIRSLREMEPIEKPSFHTQSNHNIFPPSMSVH